jgi:addiction module RelE/StbE family toxin
MVQEIVWTRKALCDLKDVFDYIKKDSNYYASLTTDELLNKVKLLKLSPLLGKIVPEFNNPDLRELLHKKYRIIYKLESDNIYIVRIYHSSRLLSSI